MKIQSFVFFEVFKFWLQTMTSLINYQHNLKSVSQFSPAKHLKCRFHITCCICIFDYVFQVQQERENSMTNCITSLKKPLWKVIHRFIHSISTKFTDLAFLSHIFILSKLKTKRLLKWNTGGNDGKTHQKNISLVFFVISLHSDAYFLSSEITLENRKQKQF